MSRFAREFEPFYRTISEDIFAFCRALNFVPTFQQAWILEDVQDAAYGRGSRRIAAKAGQGPGKSKAGGVALLWWVLRNVDTLSIVSAPTMKQAKKWLEELQATLSKADRGLQKLIKCTKTKIVIAGRDQWRIELMTATKRENAQGIHNDKLAFLLDEASGIPRELCEQVEGTLTNDEKLLILLGNPNTRDCFFFDCFNSQRHRWKTRTLNAEDSPLVSREKIDYFKEKYGHDSDFYRISVLGEFPFQDPRCLMSAEDLERCTRTNMLELVKVPRRLGGELRPARQIGIDLARFGGDENVIYRRSGEALVEFGFWPHTEPTHIVGKAFEMQGRARWSNEETWYVPDAGGIGQGVLGTFYDAGKNVYEFHFGRKLGGKEHEDEQTRAWFALAGKVKQRKVYIPNDSRLIQQLSGRQYLPTKKGSNELESKQRYMDRGFESPDRADAAVMAFFDEMITDGQVSFVPRGKPVGSGKLLR